MVAMVASAARGGSIGALFWGGSAWLYFAGGSCCCWDLLRLVDSKQRSVVDPSQRCPQLQPPLPRLCLSLHTAKRL